MSSWRRWALIVGVLVTACGLWFWVALRVPTILIFGVVILVTAALEPIYGRSNGTPRGGNWRATDERFVDPETGKLVTVWFDPVSGDRRYVDEETAGGPPVA